MANGVAAQFDLIEVFGYVIPGTVLLAGLVAPLQVSVPTAFPTLAGFTLLAILSFLVGMVIPVTLGGVHGGVRELPRALGDGSTRSESMINEVYSKTGKRARFTGTIKMKNASVGKAIGTNLERVSRHLNEESKPSKAVS